MGQRGLFYGWVVLAAAATVIAVAMGALFSLGVFLKPIEDTMGWSRSAISLVALINWLAMGLGSFVWGALSDRIGGRVVAAAGGFVLGLGLVLSSQVATLGQFYVTFGVLVGFAVGAFYAPLTATATKWFTTNRGLAVGVVSAGIGVGTFLMAPLSRWLTSRFDWRVAMLLLGDLAWLVVIPVALLIRNAPSDMGAVALGPAARLLDGPGAARATVLGDRAHAPRLLRGALGPHLPHGDARDRSGRGVDGRGDGVRRVGPGVDRRADRLRPPRRPLRRQAHPRRGPDPPGGDGLRIPLHARGRELLRGRRRLRRGLRRRHAPLRPRHARILRREDDGDGIRGGLPHLDARHGSRLVRRGLDPRRPRDLRLALHRLHRHRGRGDGARVYLQAAYTHGAGRHELVDTSVRRCYNSDAF